MYLFRVLIFITFLNASCNGAIQEVDFAKIKSYETFKPQNDSLLKNIQGKIYEAFVQGMMSNKNEELLKLRSSLEYFSKKNNQKIIVYWRAYLQYYNAIYHIKLDQKELSEKEVDNGIELLNKLENKNSEDYALLAMLEGFSIQFKGIKAMIISRNIKKHGELSIKIDPENIRSYYVLGSNDYYSPKKYGGGKKVEKYLLKAVSLPSQKIKNEYLPSWGKEESYELLIKYYIEIGNLELAKKYYKEGISKYPGSYQLNKLASKLI